MARYKVIKPWYGVAKGEVVELEKLHPVLKANVVLIDDESSESGAGHDDKELKKSIVARLKELKIKFNGRDSVDDLAALLPEGELEQLTK